MRMKSFFAPTMTKAMEPVRPEMGVRPISADVGDGVNPVNPLSLVRLIMAYTGAHPAGYPTMTDRTQAMTEAAL